MPRPRRTAPLAQMSLFDRPQEARRQNNRWITNAVVTVNVLLESTRREPEDSYGRETSHQRPLDRNHCQAIAAYYQETGNWVIPPFVFTAQAENLSIEDGQFKNLDSEHFTILDGQHRVQALHITRDTLAGYETNEAAEKLHRLLDSYVVLEFIQTFNDQDASQMFVDLNKSKKMSAAELAYLDGRDPIVNIIKETLNRVSWVQDRTDTVRARPGRGSADVFSVSTLKTIVKALEVGVKAAMPRSRREYLATSEGQREGSEKLAGFLEWLLMARFEYHNLKDRPDMNVGDELTRHYAYDIRFVSLLAQTWANSQQTNVSPEALSVIVQQLNIFRTDPANDVQNQLQLVDPRGRLKAFSTGAYGAADIMLREKATHN